MASKKVDPHLREENSIVGTTPTLKRFNYTILETTKRKRFVFSRLEPATKYAFRVSVRMPDGMHFGVKSAVQFYTSPKNVPTLPATASPNNALVIPKTSAIVGGFFVALAVVVCFFLVALYYRRQKRLQTSLERLHQSMYDRRAGVTFNVDGGDDDRGGGMSASSGGRRGRRNRGDGRRFGPFSNMVGPRGLGYDRVALLDDVGGENDDDDVDGGVDDHDAAADNVVEAETFQPFQSFAAPDRNEADLGDLPVVSQEQMNNERNDALSSNNNNNNGSGGGRGRRRNNNNNNDDDDALLLGDDFDDGPVINAFAFNDEPPMIIA